jgi:multidrug efflux pump subunit AcrA (membrane-fusion protein)
MSERNLDYAELRAPENGVVVRRLARAGDLATPGRPLVVLETGGGREVRVTWPAELEWAVAPGAEAEVQLPRRDRVLPARIDRVSPSADGHTLEAYLRVEGLDVPSGTFVDVVLLGEPAPVLRLPEGARVERGSLEGVFTVEDGRASLRWLRLTPDGRVLAGLSPGDSVILNPPADLRNGDAVEAGS